jgi:hypothetical protein
MIHCALPMNTVSLPNLSAMAGTTWAAEHPEPMTPTRFPS